MQNKHFFFIVGIFLTTTTFSQNLISNKGENYLPENGEWSIGFNATSTLNYFGNLFNSAATPPTLDDYIANSIYGKMMLSNNSAIRLTVGFNMNKNTDRELVSNENSFADGLVENVETMSTTNITIGVGQEWRRGSTRLQGLYGVEAQIQIESSSTTWEYGNSAEAREAYLDPVESKTGTELGLQFNPFIGFEYFILPKISISAEYKLGLFVSIAGEGSLQTATYDFDDDNVEMETTDTASDSFGGIQNYNQGLLGLHFYF